MRETKIIIIRGNSGSGKTTLAKQLQNQFKQETLLISQDVVRREMLKTRDGQGTKALPLLIDLVRYGKENCDIVILEGILNAKWYLPLFEDIKREFGNHIYAYYYDLPFEETLKRHSQRAQCHEFGEKEMRQWWNEKDLIPIIEEKIISKQQSLEESIRQILSDIHFSRG